MRHAPTVEALAAVRRLSFAALAAPDARGIVRSLAAELFEVFDVDQVHVSRLAQDGTVSRGTMFRAGPEAEPDHGHDYVLPLDGPSGVRRVALTGRPFHAPDAAASDEVAQALVERFDVASALFVPLEFEDEVRAVVVLVTETRREFDEREIQLVYTLANQASSALAVLDMKDRLNARADQQTALARAASALNARLDRQAVLETMCREAAHALAGDLAGVYMGDGRGGGVAIAAHGVPPDSDWWGSTIDAGEGVAGHVLATGEPVVSNDYKREAKIPGADVLAEVQTAASVPVRWEGDLKGALSVAFYSMRRLSEEDIETLQAIADLAAVACSNAEAFESAQVAARTDSLTGFLNHGAVHVRVREEIWRARRSGLPLSCILLDLDSFKPINDRYGHLVGDEILQAVARVIAAEFRAYDGIARYGGDEFVLVLPETGQPAARSAAERLRRMVAEVGRSFADLGIRVTASVGVAQWREPLSAAELLDRADRALLLAKQRGKDAVVVGSVETELELATLETQASTGSSLVTEFWALVTSTERPRDVLTALPAFLRRTLSLEEVALYEPNPGSGHRSLVRAASARAPGDPGPAAFHQSVLAVGDGLLSRLAAGAVSRSSLRSLQRALEIPHDPLERQPPAGSCAVIALARGDRLHGLLLLRASSVSFPLPVLRLAETVAGHAVTVLLGQASGASPAAVAALAAAIDARDRYTLSHSEQVVGLACDVSHRLGLSPHQVQHVRDAATVHDVGKVSIPNEILFKGGALSEPEWKVMRQHPLIGEAILRRTPELTEIAPIVRHEHERWDGRGYPDGLARSAIPIASRIISACDAYAAMITERPYRAALSEAQAVATLEEEAGGQFDPDVVDALIGVLARRDGEDA